MPAEGVRVTPTMASQMNFPKIVSPGDNQPAIQTAVSLQSGVYSASRYYKFIGVEIVSKDYGSANSTHPISNLIMLGDFVIRDDMDALHVIHQDRLWKVPHHLVLDRCYIHAHAEQNATRGVALNSAYTDIINCYISDFKSDSQDAQAVWGWNGPGPFTIENNYLEASGECLGFGGELAMHYTNNNTETPPSLLPACVPRQDGLIPSCITIRHNTLTKKLSWRGKGWKVKNLFELKNAQYVTVDGNLMEYCWVEADQAGFAVQLTVRNQSSPTQSPPDNPWSTLKDIWFTNNLVRHAGGGVNLMGTDSDGPPSVRMQRVIIANNLFDDINSIIWGGDGAFIQIARGVSQVTVNHNTALQYGNLEKGNIQDGKVLLIDSMAGVSDNFVMTNNISPHNNYGVFGGGSSSGLPTFNAFFSSYTFSHNVLPGKGPIAYPPDTYDPGTINDVGFTKFNYGINGDYRLAAGTLYKGQATDGTDIGYDAVALNAATGNPMATDNPLEDARFFVYLQYRDFLNRQPDAGGLDYWIAKITDCGADAVCVKQHRINVSAAFFIELEFQDTGSFVYRFYKASFGRQPTYAEFTLDRAQVIGGVSLDAQKTAFANNWVQRSSFLALYPSNMSNTDFVNTLYNTAGLMPYTTERANHIAEMNAGKTRAKVLREVIEISAFKAREYNPSFVLMQYFGYLKRDIDQDGYDFWLNVLNGPELNNYRGMVCSFITSAEYQDRFSTVRTRSNAECGDVNSPQGHPQDIEPIPPPPVDTVWLEDSVPTGATPHAGSDNADSNGQYESWNWTNTNPRPFSSALFTQSHLISGLHQVYFDGATQTLSVNPGDSLYAYVYLDPTNPPGEIMLQWYDGSWEHRAYWGANNINVGTNGTDSRRYIGLLPATGKWVRLEVPATQLGLGGHTLNGMALTMYDGKASWDYAGKSTPQELFYNAPFNLTASVASNTSVNLTWSAPTGIAVDHYQVERSQSMTGPFTALPGNPQTTGFTDSSVSSGGATYFYRVCAVVVFSGSYTGYSYPAWVTTANAAPAINLTSPANGATYNSPASITVTANANDSDGSISKVDFYQGTTLIGTSTVSPFSMTWNGVAAGNYTLTAKATDSGGATTTSSPVSITVNTPPTVILAMPDDGPLFTAPANLALNAYANDFDGTVSKVDFYQDANLIGTINGPLASGTPYTFQWNNVSAGTYTLTAKATDNLGATTTSGAVKIKANLMPPFFYDNFNDNTRDAAKWNLLNVPSVVTVAEQNHRLEISPSTTTAAYNGYSSASAINLTNAQATVEVVQTTAPVGSAQTLFGIWGGGSWGSGGLLIVEDGGNIYFQLSVNNVITQNYSIPYDPVQHHYWRIRHDVASDTILWETSADAVTWTTRLSVARPFPITAMYPVLYAGKWGTEVSQPGTAIFDNFRVDSVNQVNVALASNGATASASSYFNGFSPSGAINGDRKGLGLGQNGYWSTGYGGFQSPVWIEVDFSGNKTITEIDVFTVQDNYSNPSEPTQTMTFSQNGMTGYEVQYWNGSAWVDVTGGNVTNNNLVWRRFAFAPLTTSKIRILSHSSPDTWSRATEIEAWGN
ncbi:MAG: Ig-like domain-containing protein [Pyrinomonadaceae bacterium]